MTNKEAIVDLEILLKNIPKYLRSYQSISMGIKALKQEPSGDLISRQDAIDAVKTRITYAKAIDRNGNEYNLFESENSELKKAIRNIEGLPSVNPQPMCEEREKGECPYYAG